MGTLPALALPLLCRRTDHRGSHRAASTGLAPVAELVARTHPEYEAGAGRMAVKRIGLRLGALAPAQAVLAGDPALIDDDRRVET